MTEISQETMMFKREPDKREVADTIKEVYTALEEKVILFLPEMPSAPVLLCYPP